MLHLIVNRILAIYNGFLEYQLNLVKSVQSNFDRMEPIFEFVSEELNPNIIISYLGPLLGVGSMDSMAKNLYTIGTVLLTSDILKWTIHEDRPYWWCRENDLPPILQHRLTCETTSGLPSGHSAAIVVLSYLILAYVGTAYKNFMYLIVVALCLLMFMSRLYFGCHFLHQCIIGGMLAYNVSKLILYPEIWQYIIEAGKKFHTTIIVFIGLVALLWYFVMKYSNIDPHWSVRMAFKWCHDPMHLVHTNSLVYAMFREFGFMMGIALSAPLIRRTSIAINPYMSVPVTLFILIINAILRSYTPTQSGRLAFVSYGFFRSLFFTFSLLTVMPKLAMKNDASSFRKIQ